jgi:hypothetical protein
MKAGEGFRGLVFSAAQQGFRYRLTAEEAAAQLREYSRREIHDALWKTSGEAAND